MKNILTYIIASIVFIPSIAHAAFQIDVSPAIIDQKALARDILTETLTLTNNSPARLNIYATVNNIDVEEGRQEFQGRGSVILGDSLANWMSVPRGVIELKPGESTEIPVQINVNLHAKPGNYHAVIRFSYGSTRAEAENRPDVPGSVAVNIEVTEDIKERLQLGTFSTKKFFFSGDDVSFAYNLENIGNKDLQPSGEVRIYDQKGKEVGSVVANQNGTIIKPDESGQIASVWAAGNHFGKYKALLDIEYGQSQLGTVNDTIYFWIIPWKQLLFIFLLLAAVVGYFTYKWYGRYETAPVYVASRRQRQDQNALAVGSHVPTGTVSEAPSDHHVMDMRE